MYEILKKEVKIYCSWDFCLGRVSVTLGIICLFWKYLPLSEEKEERHSSSISQISNESPLNEVLPQSPKFVFTYKTKDRVAQSQEKLRYHDRLITKLPANLDWKDIVFKDLAHIEEELYSYVNKEWKSKGCAEMMYNLNARKLICWKIKNEIRIKYN